MARIKHDSIAMCEPPKYYTDQEQRVVDSFKAAFGRVAGGGALGALSGGAIHAGIQQYVTPLPLDPLVNLLDISLGGVCGLILGALWATDAALLSSGVIKGYIKNTMSALVEAEEDAQAGERALKTIREGFQTIAQRGDWPLRLAFALTGLDQEPAVYALVEEAQAERKVGAPNRPFSDLIALVFESTLETRLNDARFLAVFLTLFIGGGLEGTLYLLGSAVGAIDRYV